MHVPTRWILLSVCVSALAAGCGKPASEGAGAIEVKGSDTMVNLGQAWAEAFSEAPNRPEVTVEGGGSGTGIAALIDKNTDIAESSREMEPQEMEQAKAKGVNPVATVVAQDGLSVIVHPDNPVSHLTIQQLSDIYTGKVTNWKQLGGPDKRIAVLSREKNSGTHVFFLEHVVRMGKKDNSIQYAPSTQMQPSSSALVQQVATTPNAIGYVGLGYAAGAKVKEVGIAAKPGDKPVVPSQKSVLDKSYPISRPLYFYTDGPPTGKVKEFVDFVLSPEGQKIVSRMEFVPVR
jgi:phosphate transport system substrate-binding protein